MSKITIDREVLEQLLGVMESTGRFLHYCWQDVGMNEYSFDGLNKQMEIVDAEITDIRKALKTNSEDVSAMAQPEPPKRAWVELTTEEVQHIGATYTDEPWGDDGWSVDFATAIADKLKEKNT